MPLPTKADEESDDEFISRGMSNDTMKKEFPDQKQRLAVLYSQKRRKKLEECLDDEAVPRWPLEPTP